MKIIKNNNYIIFFGKYNKELYNTSLEILMFKNISLAYFF